MKRQYTVTVTVRTGLEEALARAVLAMLSRQEAPR